MIESKCNMMLGDAVAPMLIGMHFSIFIDEVIETGGTVLSKEDGYLCIFVQRANLNDMQLLNADSNSSHI